MSAHVCVQIIGPEREKVVRLIKAARVCREKWSAWRRPHTPPEFVELMDAIEDLDAPQ